MQPKKEMWTREHAQKQNANRVNDDDNVLAKKSI